MELTQEGINSDSKFPLLAKGERAPLVFTLCGCLDLLADWNEHLLYYLEVNEKAGGWVND